MVVLLVIVLGVMLGALAVAIAYGISLQRDIKNVTAQLAFIRENPTTRAQLTTKTFYRCIAELEESINVLIEEQQRQTLENRRAETAMRQALTNISHDLRTPLTSARGYLQLAEAVEVVDAGHRGDGHKGGTRGTVSFVSFDTKETVPLVPLPPVPEPESQRAEYLRVAGERLDALTSLINSLFEFTQITEGRELRLERIDAAAILRETLASQYEELSQTGLSVEASIPEEQLQVTGDAEALGRIFSNIITNAARHGEQHLAVQLDSNARIISFANPLPPGDVESLNVEQLFDRFYTADSSRTRQGAGLGLAIVKTLAEHMDIQVSATLEPYPQTGTQLRIQLTF
ncbi:MAG: HAMP domain-containing histidine kinase [Coriobacteriales bacterium]|jgi:signal transduction histidine kinase|nr:HAMP domain-containing histidine kinase [Coriobacteriales bacterium]